MAEKEKNKAEKTLIKLLANLPIMGLNIIMGLIVLVYSLISKITK